MPEIGYHTHGNPHDDPPRAKVCPLCGALVGDQQVHDQWHFPAVCMAGDCLRTADLKMCGPLGLRCPDHFEEP